MRYPKQQSCHQIRRSSNRNTCSHDDEGKTQINQFSFLPPLTVLMGECLPQRYCILPAKSFHGQKNTMITTNSYSRGAVIACQKPDRLVVPKSDRRINLGAISLAIDGSNLGWSQLNSAKTQYIYGWLEWNCPYFREIFYNFLLRHEARN